MSTTWLLTISCDETTAFHNMNRKYLLLLITTLIRAQKLYAATIEVFLNNTF